MTSSIAAYARPVDVAVGEVVSLGAHGLSTAALERRVAGLERAAAKIAAEQATAITELHSLATAADTAQRHARGSGDGTTIPSRPTRVRGLAMTVGLACQSSPTVGAKLITRSRILTEDLPTVHAMLAAGVLTVERAHVIADAAAVLDPEGRAALDAHIADHKNQVVGLGTGTLRNVITAWVGAIDSGALLARRENAKAGRRVRSSPCPDGMAKLTITAPVEQCAAIIGALRARAAQVIASGDPTGRSHGQIMTDLAVTRLTGQSVADAVPFTVDLVVSDDTLLAGGTGAARLGDGTPIPAALARRLVHTSVLTPSAPASPDRVTDTAPILADGDPPVPIPPDYGAAYRDAQLHNLPPQETRCRPGPGSSTPAPPPRPDPTGLDITDPEHLTDVIFDLVGHLADLTATNAALSAELEQARAYLSGNTTTALRLIYACPSTGALTATTSRARTFPTALATLIDLRDGGTCRTPYCDNPIAHHDHTTPHSHGGPTTATNGSGRCTTCNLIKDAHGHTHSTAHGAGTTARHTITHTTPGHIYTSTAPPLPTPLDMGNDAAEGRTSGTAVA